SEVLQGLRLYRTLRRDPIRFYQWASKLMTPFFQSSLPGLALRHAIAPTRREMLRSLAGIKTGVFSSSPLQEWR
ncbi:MAG: hypothetical protein SFY92_07600, partial [Verrucomicrobiae bacterium]|nr:hypothetical protein [Verrucomicrobiae bacterium]